MVVSTEVADIDRMKFMVPPRIEVRGTPGLSVQVEALTTGGPAGSVIMGGGVILPSLDVAGASGEGVPLTIEAQTDAEARRKAADAVTMIKTAVAKCAAGDTTPPANAIRHLARLVHVFGPIAWRVGEFLEYCRWLESRRQDDTLKRILGEGARGRRREDYFFLVELIDQIRAREDCSVAVAAGLASKRFGEYFDMTSAAIQNRYSELKDLYHAARGSQYMPDEHV